MFRRWWAQRQRGRQLRATVAALNKLPAVQDADLIRFVMRSFDPPTSVEKASSAFLGACLDVSTCGFAQHGRCAFGLDANPSAVLALRTQTSILALLELVFDEGELGMCGVEIRHVGAEFIQAGMNIECALQKECRSLGYEVTTWEGDVIPIQRHDVEGLWWSNLADSGNVLRLVERRFGQCYLVRG